MKKFVWLAVAVAVSFAWGEPPKALHPFVTEKGALESVQGHIQGACCTDDGVFIGHIKGIVKVDWSGKLLAVAEGPVHTGDVCHRDGKIYAAVSLRTNGKTHGQINIYDAATLKKERTVDLPRSSDGICWLGDTLYIGVGPNPKDPHRGFHVARFDKDLNHIDTKKLDCGYEVRYGTQCIATDGKDRLFLMLYPAKGAPGTAIYDKDLNLLGTIKFHGSTGFDLLPAKFQTGANPRFLRVMTAHKWRDKNRDPEKDYKRGRIEFFELTPDGKGFVPVQCE
ncbi:MAG: hypothetical protein IJR99_07285 [Kiritimatiellae bacterium]|nr:hypothetical protein [Kiritimatiellia bacterium]